jgi:hypothetical protein
VIAEPPERGCRRLQNLDARPSRWSTAAGGATLSAGLGAPAIF